MLSLARRTTFGAVCAAGTAAGRKFGSAGQEPTGSGLRISYHQPGTPAPAHRRETPMIAFLIPVLSCIALIPMIGLRLLAKQHG
ncbi:MAG: hypothetical protein QOF10_5341 [Kribbellaceae bacterium]|jgi:hypothetical protein|nr:hypothetical protein [Kribbellaceae bacterium]